MDAKISPGANEFTTPQSLFQEVSRLLDENKMIFETFGPGAAVARKNPLTGAVRLWDLRWILLSLIIGELRV